MGCFRRHPACDKWERLHASRLGSAWAQVMGSFEESRNLEQRLGLVSVVPGKFAKTCDYANPVMCRLTTELDAVNAPPNILPLLEREISQLNVCRAS